MKSALWMVAVGVAAVLWTAGLLPAAEETAGPRAPFVIPPSGRSQRDPYGGDQLVGSLGYQAPCALAFDGRNRPYLFNSCDAETSGYLVTLRRGKWVRRSFAQAVKEACPRFASFVARPGRPHVHALGSMTIDAADALYAVVFIREAGGRTRPVLVYSADLGETFRACRLPGHPAQAFLEVQVGHNDLPGPPAVGLLARRKKHPARWTDYHVLSVAIPEKDNGRLRWPSPVRVTENCFGISNHSGGYSFAVTVGGRTHLVWAEIPPEGETGNPTFAATLDRRDGRILARERLATAPPETPDVHSTPVIAADSRGYLHVVAGAHGQRFLYVRSRQPGRVDAGWTAPEPVGRRQTYAALVCGPKNRLHLAFREWQDGLPALCFQQKPAMVEAWPASRALVRPPEGHRGYGIFYHRLFIDRAGAMYLSFTFNDTKGGTYPRGLAVSENGGRTWHLADAKTFLRRTLSPSNAP